MRFIYDNQIDSLVASQLTALTTTELYEATKVTDERLTTQWRSTSPTAQTLVINAGSDTIVGGNIGLVTGSAATNLITDPENMTSGNWTKQGQNPTVATGASILGVPAYSVTQPGTSGFSSIASASFAAGGTVVSASYVIRKSTAGTGRVHIWDSSAARYILLVDVVFVSKTVTFDTGTAAIPPEWIDDDTVRIFCLSATTSPSNTLTTSVWADKDSGGGGAANLATIYSAPMVIRNTHPVPYVATSRGVLSESYTNRIPPSGKFIIDCEFKPFFPFNISTTVHFLGWRISGTQRLGFSYQQSSDKFQVGWVDGGTDRALDSNTYAFASTLNVYIRMTASLDLTTGNTTGSKLYFDNVVTDEAWSGNIDALSSSAFTTLDVGHLNGLAANSMDGIFRYMRIYGGTLTETITTEAEMDAALALRQLTFEASTGSYQSQFNVNTLAVLGHNISEEADIKVELNDWDEWNYTDGSGSSIIQNTMTWDSQTILTFLSTKVKRQYARFTINDPNNDDGDVRVGRFWVGDYLDVSPSSLLNFKVTKQTSDRTIYGRNRQKWSDEGVKWRKFEMQFPRTPDTSAQSMLSKIQRMYDNVGNAHSLIFANFDTVRDYQIVEPVYASIVGPIAFNHRASQKYEYAITLEEDK